MSDRRGPVDLHHTTLPADLRTAVDLVSRGVDGSSGTVMWWSPTMARWERHPGRPEEAAFELRAFDTDVEIRWLRTPDGGTMTVLATDAGRESLRSRVGESLREGGGDSWISTTYARQLPATYVLWGETDDAGQLAEARVGAVDVPLAHPSPGRRYQLEAVEYVVVDPGSGTAFVGEERLIAVSPIAPRRDAAGGGGPQASPEDPA